jgi:hypothetical protein
MYHVYGICTYVGFQRGGVVFLGVQVLMLESNQADVSAQVWFFFLV